MLAVDGADVELLDRAGRRAIDALRGQVVAVVTQVGADDEQRFGAAPERFEHAADLLGGRRVADQQRHDLELLEHRLQEGQLHLEAVLEAVRAIELDDLGELRARARPRRARRRPRRAASGTHRRWRARAREMRTRWLGPTSTTRRMQLRSGRRSIGAGGHRARIT